MTGHAWPRGRAILLAAYALALAAGSAIILTRAVEPTMPVYLELAEWLRRGPLPSSFEPLGYPWLLSLIPVSSPVTAVVVLHAASFVAFTTGMVWTAIHFADAPRAMTAHRVMVIIAGAAALLSPYGLVNLVRVNDNGVNVLLTFTLSLLIYRAASRPGHRAIPALGLLMGVMTFVRPNCLALMPVVVAAGVLSPSRLTGMHAAATMAATGAASYLACALLATGTATFWPANGPYNLFAGNNPAASTAIMHDYNAEPSLPAGLAWCGVTSAPRSVPPDRYLECTRRYLQVDPAGALTLAGYKAYNLLWRPNLRLADSFVDVTAQAVSLILPLLWWGASVTVWVRRRQVMDWRAAAIVVLFALPFVLTNSDPRFRQPLEPVYALSLMRAFGSRQVAL